MSNATAATHDIPAPPPPGTADVVDEMLTGLDAPPQARRRVLTILLSAISVASLLLAVQFKDDLRYAMASASATDLGEGITATPTAADANHLVTLRARPSMAGAVTYSRVLLPGQHMVFPVAGREGQSPLGRGLRRPPRGPHPRRVPGSPHPLQRRGRALRAGGRFVHESFR